MSWEARLADAKAQIAPVTMLVGEWVGRGQAHGEPTEGRLRVRMILNDSMVEVWERVGDHEDLCIYRYDPDLQQIRVLHLMEGATAEHAVELVAMGLVWVTPSEHPAVEWRMVGDRLECDVVWPGRKVAEVSMTYRREA